MKKRMVVGTLVAMSLHAALFPSTARAATTLSYQIVSWQVVGLDSNSPETSAPEIFVLQAEVTNAGAEAATDVVATLGLSPHMTCGGPCVTLVSDATYEIASIGAGQVAHAFWTVRVAKTDAAFSDYNDIPGTTTGLSLAVSGANVSSATFVPQPDHTVPPLCGQNGTSIPGDRLFVERLISQNRNDVISYAATPGTQRPDGSWEVPVGSTFTVTVQAHTATSYDEISVPATLDPEGLILPSEVAFEFELGTPSDDDVYTSQAGGDVTARYTYLASAVGTVTLAQLIYDCSGGSFHYNADYLGDRMTIHIVDSPTVPATTQSDQPQPSAPVSEPERPTLPATGDAVVTLWALAILLIVSGLWTLRFEQVVRPLTTSSERWWRRGPRP